MNAEDIVEKTRKIAENSKRALTELETKLALQDEELRLLKEELTSMGVDYTMFDGVPTDLMRVEMPKDVAPLMEQFRELVQQFEEMPPIPSFKKSIHTGRFNPLNKLKML